jgi:hypothetical protein
MGKSGSKLKKKRSQSKLTLTILSYFIKFQSNSICIILQYGMFRPSSSSTNVIIGLCILLRVYQLNIGTPPYATNFFGARFIVHFTLHVLMYSLSTSSTIPLRCPMFMVGARSYCCLQCPNFPKGRRYSQYKCISYLQQPLNCFYNSYFGFS